MTIKNPIFHSTKYLLFLLKLDIVLYKRKKIYLILTSLPLVVKVMIIANINQGDIVLNSYFPHWFALKFVCEVKIIMFLNLVHFLL